MFSVVIPLYNKAPHIEATVQSVLAQQLQPDEIIVVDDGSTDGGDTLVRAYADRGVTMIRQRNAGVSAARNLGVSTARSAYVAFLDADDEWLPTHLAGLRDLIRRVPDVGLYSTLHRVRLAGQSSLPQSAYPSGYVGPVGDFFTAMAVGLSLINSSTACVRRSSLLEIGGFPVGMRRGEDLVVWIKMARAFGMAHMATVTAIYNRDAVNRSERRHEQAVPGSLQYLGDLIRRGEIGVAESRSANLFFDRVAFYTAAGMKLTGDLHGLHAIRRLALDMHLPALVAKLTLLTVTPNSILSLGQRLRHTRVPSTRGAASQTLEPR